MSPATAGDVDAIRATIEANRGDPAVFLRTRADIRRHASEFILAREPGGVVIGCAAVHAHGSSVAEILSVSILPSRQGRGVGRLLMEEAVAKARAAGHTRVWLATSKPSYFERLGFEPMSKWNLPVSVLVAKLARVFTQPPARWLPALFGRFTFMACSAAASANRAQADGHKTCEQGRLYSSI